MVALNYEDMRNLGIEVTQLWLDDGELVVCCPTTHRDLCCVVVNKLDRTGAEGARIACSLAAELSRLWSTRSLVLACDGVFQDDEVEVLLEFNEQGEPL